MKLSTLGWPISCQVENCIEPGEFRDTLIHFLYKKFYSVKSNPSDDELLDWCTQIVN